MGRHHLSSSSSWPHRRIGERNSAPVAAASIGGNISVSKAEEASASKKKAA